MITGAEMVEEFARNTRVLKRNLTEVNDDLALIRMENGGNSINWLLGHMMKSRLDMLKLLGVTDADLYDRLEPYRRGRENGYLDSELLPLEELVSRWDELGEHVNSALPGVNMEGDGGSFGTLGKAVLFYSFHEAYHIGQAGILRRAVGLEGKIG